MARDGGVVIGEFTVIRQSGFMPQQLTQRERAFRHSLIQTDQSITHQRQRCGGENCLGETPPGHGYVGLLRREE